jgi:hypothetical protein
LEGQRSGDGPTTQCSSGRGRNVAQDYLVKGAVDSRGLVKSIRYAIERMRADQRTHLAGVADPVTAVANSAVFADRLQLALDPFETPGIDPPRTARL